MPPFTMMIIIHRVIIVDPLLKPPHDKDNYYDLCTTKQAVASKQTRSDHLFPYIRTTITVTTSN